MEGIFPIPFAQYAAPIVTPPEGVIEDWTFFYRLAARMGLPLKFAGRTLDMTTMPTSDELLHLLAERGRVPWDDLRAAPHGITDEPATVVVAPAGPEPRERLQLWPDDVAAEFDVALARSRAGAASADFPLLLTVRRMREVMNSLGRDVTGLPSHPYNPAYLNPKELADRGLSDEQVVEITSAHGRIHAVVHADDKVRPGVLSMTHAWGGLVDGEDPRAGGSNVNRLLSMSADLELVNHMPMMSAVPVDVTAARG
jgi:anaerobic selenocysteine-containing dehydrogenase